MSIPGRVPGLPPGGRCYEVLAGRRVGDLAVAVAEGSLRGHKGGQGVLGDSQQLLQTPTVQHLNTHTGIQLSFQKNIQITAKLTNFTSHFISTLTLSHMCPYLGNDQM